MKNINRRKFLFGTASAVAGVTVAEAIAAGGDLPATGKQDFNPGSIDDPNPGFPKGDSRRPSTYSSLMKMDSPKDLRVMYVVAHPDDAELLSGATIAKLSASGASVKIVSVTDGRRGHQIRNMREMIKVRYDEAQAAGRALGVEEYVVGPIPDCELTPSPENRAWLTNQVRRFAPHILVTHRTCDYHTDHRACAQLVQDMAYLLGVPLWCPSAPVPEVLPIVLYTADWFTVPRPFRPDIISDCTDWNEKYLDGLMAHPSQMFEWLCPQGDWDREVPPESDEAWRRRLVAKHYRNPSALAEKYRTQIEGLFRRTLEYAEAFEIGEYGRMPSERERKVLESIGIRFTAREN